MAAAPRQRRRRAIRKSLQEDTDLEVAGTSGRPDRVGFRPHHAVAVPRCLDLQGSSQTTKDKPQTTAMLRNIPNRYTQASLLREIDSAGFEGTYDFFYLPMDTHNRTNVGYAFINFRRNQDFDAFTKAFAGYRFKEHSSQKIARVSPAHLQGFHENVQHFSNRAVTHSRNSQYRPVVMQGGKQWDLRGAKAATEDVAAALPVQAAADFACEDPAEEAAPRFSYLDPTAEEFVPTLADPGVGYNHKLEDLTSTPLVPVNGSWVPYNGNRGMIEDMCDSNHFKSAWNTPQPFPCEAFDACHKLAKIPNSRKENIMKPFSLSKNGLEMAVSKLLQEWANPAEAREMSSTEGASCSQSSSMSQRSTSPVALHDQVTCPGDSVGDAYPPGFSHQTPRTLLNSTYGLS